MADASTQDKALFDQQLKQFRSEIDAVDDKLIALIKERCGIVKKVGELKKEHQAGKCPLRPGREAEQVKRVTAAFRESLFMPAAAASMWRMMIMGSLAIEGEIRISVHAAPGQRDFYWLAREYFGPFTTVIKQPTPKRVLGDVIEGKAAIGVLPPFQGNAQELRWWTDVPSNGGTPPKVFATLPFVHSTKITPDTPTALAVGLIEPEETGDDLSYLLIAVDENVSQMKMQAAFASAKLEARWVEVLALVPGKRHHLVEVKAFIDQNSASYKEVCAGLGNAIISTSFLGAVASPVVLA